MPSERDVIIVRVLVVSVLFVVTACEDPASTQDMSGDMAPDMTAIVDLSGPDFAGISCGNMTCASPNVCCVTPSRPADTRTAARTSVAAGPAAARLSG